MDLIRNQLILMYLNKKSKKYLKKYEKQKCYKKIAVFKQILLIR
jgi:hypothetical protein